MSTAAKPSERRRVALITGDAQGMGRAVAERLARTNVCLVLCDVEAAMADQAANVLRQGGAEVMALACEVTDETAVAKMIAAIDAKYGRLDIVVNSAGILDVNGGSFMSA